MFRSSVRFCQSQGRYIFEVRGPKNEYSTGMRDTMEEAEAAARAAVRSYKRAGR